MILLRNPVNGVRIDATHTMYPSQLTVHSNPEPDQTPTLYFPPRPDTYYGFVLDGVARVTSSSGVVVCDLAAGGYFSVPGGAGGWELELNPKYRSCVVVITRFGYRGQFITGRIEQKGRLSYIDGCSDSMLIYPPRLGDPVFNHLHFPSGIRQTQHTHPSIRLGIVARGRGVAWGPWPHDPKGPEADARSQASGFSIEGWGGKFYWNEELSPGSVFMLEEQEMHSFRTGANETMDVIAFHPDSDWGPTDALHPMLNRTYLGGQVGP